MLHAQPTRFQKSLAGVNCCFCEEPLNYTLTDTGVSEKSVALECGHTAHHDCMVSMAYSLDGELPECTSCGEISVPLDESLKADILKLAAFLPSTPALDSPLVESHFPTGTTVPWSPWAARPSGESTSGPTNPRMDMHKLSTISNTSSTISAATKRSHLSNSSISSIDSLDYRMSSSTSPSHSIQETCPAIPPAILDIRLLDRQELSIELTPELDILTAPLNEPAHMTVAVSITMPPEAPAFMATPLANAEERDMATANIETTVSDWKTLDFSLFGSLRLADSFYISRRKGSWQLLDCYLFDNILVFIRTHPDKPATLKGSVAVKDHLVSLSVTPFERSYQLTLHLSTVDLPALHMKTNSTAVLENWYAAILDKELSFPVARLSPQLTPTAHRTSGRLPVDFVVLVPLSGSPHGSKFLSIRATIFALLRQMELFDRISLVPYGGGSQQYVFGLAGGSWTPWTKIVNGLQPTARAGSKTDLLCGITTAFSVLADRKTRNPIASVLIISDSVAEISKSSLEVIASRSRTLNASISAFGVSNHQADNLHAITSHCGGSYYYVNKWMSLIETVLGQFRSLQKYQQAGAVNVSLQGAPGVSLVNYIGNNARPTLNQSTIPESPPLTPDSSSTEYYDSKSQQVVVDLGDIMSGETKTFLAQVRIANTTLRPEMPLFTASVGDVSSSISVPYLPDSSQPSPLLDIKSPLGRDFNKPLTLAPEPFESPSMLYGQLLDTPRSKYNPLVSYRRVSLIGLNIIESVAKTDLKDVAPYRVVKSIDSARILIKHLQSVSKDSSNSSQLKSLVVALDEVLGRVLKEIKSIAAFKEDYQRYLIQCVGTLKSERGLVGRSKLEDVFSQSLRDDMKVF